MSTMVVAFCLLFALFFVISLYVLAFSVFRLSESLARRADVREIHPIPREKALFSEKSLRRRADR